MFPHPISLRLRATFVKAVLRILLAITPRRVKTLGMDLAVPRHCFTPLLTITTKALAALAKALVRLRDGGLLLDVGTGVGAIALASASPSWFVVGTDIDLKCLKASRDNALRNGLYALYSPVACDSASAFRDEVFDLVTVNPPYLPLNPSSRYDVSICGGLSEEISTRMIETSYRSLRRRGVLLAASSSISVRLTSKLAAMGARRVLEYVTPLDTVMIWVLVKKS